MERKAISWRSRLISLSVIPLPILDKICMFWRPVIGLYYAERLGFEDAVVRKGGVAL